MKKVRAADMTPGEIQGTRGTVEVYDIIQGDLTAGVRIVKADSDVPTRPHNHSEKQVIYVISGTGEISNGTKTFDLIPDDFILLESNEEHYVMTKNDDLKIFEVKYP
ncbi:MAG: cupin domain-containing protein [Candidatus Thorarchaeota archaeon]|nr:cupin domain-containing protein [Candidatus Thorarchaeota archaeon]